MIWQITKSRFSSVDTKIAYYIFCKDILRYQDLLRRSLELPHARWEPTCGAQRAQEFHMGHPEVLDLSHPPE